MSFWQENPVLIKEVRGRLRARRQSKGSRNAAFLVVGGIVLLLYFFGTRTILGVGGGASQAEGMYVFFTLGVELTLVLFLVPPLAAGSITQEREQQTWNALLLSRLTAREIVFGKFIAALLPTLLILAIFAPLCLLAAFVGGLSVLAYVMSNLLLLATTAFFTALSLFWSWAYRRTYVATSASFASVAFFTVGTLLIWGLVETARQGGSGKAENFVPMWLNPYNAMWFVLDSGNRHYGQAAFYLAFCVLVSGVLLYVTTKRLAKGPKEMEQ